jgi:electron transport complex protein RnfC
MGADLVEMPCIRCGDCATACPERLQPQQLLRDLRAGDLPRSREHGLDDCSLCGRCDPVCPSHIPLLQQFREAQSAIREQDAQARMANAAREHFERREARLKQEAIERTEREATLAQHASSTDAVAAAIERARAKRQQPRTPT